MKWYNKEIMKNEKFFNFPINLIDGFLDDSTKCLNNIFSYSIYKHILTYEEKEGFEWIDYEDEEKAVEIAESFFGVNKSDKKTTFINGEKLYNNIGLNCPFTRINVNVLKDFHNDPKTEFEKVVLLAHLALLSTNKEKPYSKVDKNFIYSRMNGFSKSLAREYVDEKLIFPDPRIKEQLHPKLQKYFTKRYWDKIKEELSERWYWFIPTELPVYDKDGNMTVKKIRRINYFTQLPQEKFYSVIIKEEEKKKEKKNTDVLRSIIENYNKNNK
jgi:hypothetical protein